MFKSDVQNVIKRCECIMYKTDDLEKKLTYITLSGLTNQVNHNRIIKSNSNT